MSRKAFTGDPAYDLSDEVTVFVSTVGEPTTETCLQRLSKQDCRFRIRIIRNVTPLSVAFQTMIDQCETPFYVQVDADMLLKPHAISWLYEKMQMGMQRDPKLAMFSSPLYDVHMGMVMVGVKIYQHAAMDQVPYRDLQSCEVDQLQRLEELGYTWAVDYCGDETVESDSVVGLHGTGYTNYAAFERYRDLMEKQRRLGTSPFVEKLLPRFLESFVERQERNPNRAVCDLWSAIGIIVGASSDLTTQSGEKDATCYGENDEVFVRIREMLTGGKK